MVPRNTLKWAKGARAAHRSPRGWHCPGYAPFLLLGRRLPAALKMGSNAELGTRWSPWKVSLSCSICLLLYPSSPLPGTGSFLWIRKGEFQGSPCNKIWKSSLSKWNGIFILAFVWICIFQNHSKEKVQKREI
jgi:hypothetical protein